MMAEDPLASEQLAPEPPVSAKPLRPRHLGDEPSEPAVIPDADAIAPDADASEPAVALAAELEASAAVGLEAFDPGGVHTVRRLLERLATVPATARPALVVRARAHLAALRERFEARRTELRGLVEGLRDDGHDPEGHLGQALEAGQLLQVARAARRLAVPRSEAVARARAAVRERLAARVAERLSDHEAGRAALDPSVLGTLEPLELARRLYRESVADTKTEIEARRASTPPPENTGHYHGPTIAARALAAMGALHRPYLRAQLGRLEAFEALEVFIAREGQPPEASAPRKGKAPSRKPARRR